MEVQIISRELIKPSSPTVQHKRPYKLTLLDQLTPTTYFPLILFYPMNNVSTTLQTLTHLKESLSQTLNLYYPFSGRPTCDNLYINRFNEGVPFFEAKVNCSMSEFLKLHQTELLNSFLPCNPYTKEVSMEIPIIAFQVSMFTCGGITLGLSMSHKLIDAVTASAFMSTWTSLHRRDFNGVIAPYLHEPSLFFPSRISFPQGHLSLMESLWFTEANYITKRFSFNPKAIATLKTMAKGDRKNNVDQPTRIETLSCFIWKYCMQASSMVESSRGSESRTSILVEAVDLRKKTKPPMNNGSIGNLFWWAVAVADPNDKKNTELHELASLLSESIGLYKTEYTHSLQGDNGYETMSEYCEQLSKLFSSEKPDIFAFTGWGNMSFTKPDFGWGEPYWVGVMGKAGAAFRNFTVFVDAKGGKGIEAWITLDHERMEILQRNPEFLAFASPNPRISSL
ncbi:hypothetical protein JCGZ_16162 [Jatropha curcas]|uniref:Uncharacterized protein n=1 Tax=Jatropha curcas TaxID=180498 RepID=A0A067K611_JATCU|nr:hypothetical protein JCGZ_16162 [Jatropha curcas]